MTLREKLAALLSDEAEQTFDLAAGQTARIESARAGKFNAKQGGLVDLTPAKLAWIAKNFDADGYHKLKIGHGPIETHTPDMGDVIGLEYDEAKDRLVALSVPTDSLVRKNRAGEFRRVS